MFMMRMLLTSTVHCRKPVQFVGRRGMDAGDILLPCASKPPFDKISTPKSIQSAGNMRPDPTHVRSEVRALHRHVPPLNDVYEKYQT